VADHETPPSDVAEDATDEVQPNAGLGPYRLALRRLRRNRVALGFAGLFLLILMCCLLAPVYASDIAHTGPSTEHLTETIKVGGHSVDVVNLQGVPIGPTWHSRFLLGADSNGEDVAVRLLYGGRTSIIIGGIATFITMVLGVAVGVTAGYFRGIVDGILSRLMDLIWSYPVVLLGVALGTVLAVTGLRIGPWVLSGTSLLVPAFIIGFVFIPYVAKPIRGQVLSLREKEFVEAARSLSAGHLRIMAREILPNLSSTIVVFIPLMIANAILLEAGLSFVGAGVQPPNPSWGNMISDGLQYISTTPGLVLAPAIMLVLTVLGINIFGEAVRDALDPRAQIRIEH
jgi:peptide/nickel transport system permease protein